MARTTTKKETTNLETNKIEEKVVAPKAAVKKTDDYEVLKQKNLELENKINNLMELMANLNAKKEEPVVAKIDLEKDIPVINMCVGQLNLSTKPYGRGDIYVFAERHEIMDIPFGDLKQIVQSNSKFAREGAFIILDDDAIKALRLKTRYDKMLGLDDMKDILHKDANQVIALYNMASPLQKEIIIDMIVDGKLNGKSIDANLLIQLGELCGKNFLNIEPLNVQEK